MAQSPYRTTQMPGAGGASASQPGSGGTWAKAILGLGCGCSSIVALVFFLFFVWLASLPESGAVPGGQMRAESVDYLRSHGLVEEGERVVYYYDYTMRMNDDESCFFTDRRVVYHRGGDQVNAIDWDDVVDMQAWEDFGQVIEVQSSDGYYLKCSIPALNDGEAFYAAMQDLWEMKLEEAEEAEALEQVRQAEQAVEH